MSGAAFEASVVGLLKAKGYEPERQIPIGKGIYGTNLRADIYVEGVPGYPDGLIVECKWQDVSGSAEEKLPYLVLNIKEHYPAPTIVAVAGDGMREGALAWLKAQEGGRLTQVFVTADELMSWVFRL